MESGPLSVSAGPIGEGMALVVKVCGLTRYEDAALAVGLGADLLGFVFAPSPRRIEPAHAGALLGRLRDEGLLAGVRTVGVFVDAPPAAILEAREIAGFDLVQLHGDETPQAAAALPVPWYKALRLATPDDFTRLCPLGGAEWACDRLLVDARVPGLAGGSGRTIPPEVALAAREAVGRAGKLFFLAGGLDAANVTELVTRLAPDGIDLASGVEAAPGIKDHAKMRRFFQALEEVRDG